MSLSCLVLVTYYTELDRSRQFNFGFGIDDTYTVYQVVVLFSFHHRSSQSNKTVTIKYCFQSGLDMIGHVVVLFGFCHKLLRSLKFAFSSHLFCE